ncbi:hypothetical protein GCM10007913_33730 [Devosia yakushimensis]|uniref:Uncharacterized protein n=1 Tax=Devosia yakushimensis TaxID=470028 RepID=A0ABQ5UL79_9HYPH|nr:hypothetical protein [Devosia yakushimensis]GLQ11441.1 hypothetical protein GCM10007913_33730 [Devosia yakushimensis]
MLKNFALLVMLAVFGASTMQVQAQDLPLLADGAPWSVKVPDGPEVQMTFNPDGSGQVKLGLFSNNVTWAVRDGAFCIVGIPEGDACMTLSVSGNSVIGTSPKGEQFVFERA